VVAGLEPHLGILVFGAMTIGGDLTWGLVELGLFLAVVGLFYFGARNETIGGLAAPGRDERWAMINQRGDRVCGHGRDPDLDRWVVVRAGKRSRRQPLQRSDGRRRDRLLRGRLVVAIPLLTSGALLEQKRVESAREPDTLGRAPRGE
jgi:hypothetical protein